MQAPEYSSVTGLGILAKSLSIRLTRDELRWLYSALKKHADDDDNERENNPPCSPATGTCGVRREIKLQIKKLADIPEDSGSPQAFHPR